MGECQSKAIGHTQESFKHIQAYLEPCVTLTHLKLCISRTYSEPEAYSEPGHLPNPVIIQNPSIVRTLTYSKSEAYS